MRFDLSFQHIKTMSADNQTFDHFNIGSGNFVDTEQSHIANITGHAHLNFFYADLLYFGGFGYFKLTEAGLNVRFVDGVGNTRYEYKLPPRH